MSTNCLVSKLKGNVNNDNLTKLAHIKFKITKPEYYSQHLNSIKFLPNAGMITADDYSYVELPNKYNLIEIGDYLNNMLVIDLDELRCCKSLTMLNILRNTNIKGDVKNLPTSIVTLGLSDFKVNIKEFGFLTNLTELRYLKTYPWTLISGSIEEFVQSQIEHGRDTCEEIIIGMKQAPTVGVGYGSVTYQGDTISTDYALKLSWTSASDISLVQYTA